MKKRFMSMMIVVCMVFTLFPTVTFAEEANPDLDTSNITEGVYPCENHKTHTEDCGFIKDVPGIDCTHECDLCEEEIPEPPAMMLDTWDVITRGDFEFDFDTGKLSIKANTGINSFRSSNIESVKVMAVVIEPDVTSIDDMAFSGLTNLTSVTFKGDTPPSTIGSAVFNNTSSELTIYVPADAVGVYKKKLTDYADKVQATANVVTNTTTNTPYDTLQKAIADVVEGETLQLDMNLKENVSITNTNTSSFTIDLNGKTLDVGSGYAISHNGAGTLTIEDSSTGKTGKVSSTISTAIHNEGTGTVAVSGGTVSSTSGTAIFNDGTGTVTVSGGKVSSAGGFAIYNKGTGKVTVSGGEVSSTKGTAIYNMSTGTVTVSGGGPVIKGGDNAMNKAPTLGAGVTVKAYSDYTAQTLVTPYVDANIATYKYLTFETGSTQVTTVEVSPKTTSVQQGNTQKFSATVTGTNSPAQTVTWKVTDGTKAETTIDANGLLTVAAGETASSLTVTATSTVDTAKSGTANVTVTKTPVTKYTLTVTGGTGGGSYVAGTSVTVTANTAPGGQRFKEWTATGITLVDKTQNPVTITMPASEVSLTAAYEDIPADIYVVTLDANGGSVTPTSISVKKGEATTLPTPSHNGSYSFDGWFTTAIGGTQYTNSTPITSNVTLYAHWTNTGGGSTGGGSSSSGSSSNITVTPSPDKLNVPTEAEIKVKAKVDSKGGATVNVSYKDVTNAIKKATAEAKKSGDEANGITLVLNATTGNKTVNTLTVNLPKTVQEKVISNKIVSTVVVVDNPDIKIGMDLKAVIEINAQAKSDVTIRSTRMDSKKLTDSAKIAIGNRPVFNLSVNYGSDKQVQNFKSGSVSVSIPYTLQAGEVAGGVYAVYVDGNGKVNYIANSSYDTNAKVLRFATNHFSIYGIGYKVPIAFTDIASHWAKSDIEFVTNRGLISGTSDTTFAPNSAMTRGMFVTALGRLAGVDVNSYKTGSFTDVKPETYYAPYVNWAASNGITNGTTPTTFSPDKNVTRQEMAMMMSNYTKVYGYTVPKTRREVIFADNRSINSWAIDAIKQMQIAGILNGKNGNMFDPTGIATRGEISAMLHRYIELVIDRNTAEGWTINDSGSAMYYRNGKAVTGSKIINRVTYKFNNYGETTQKVILAGKNN